MKKSYRVPIVGRLLDRNSRKGDPTNEIRPSQILGQSMPGGYYWAVVEWDWDDKTCKVDIETTSANHAALRTSLPQGDSTARLSKVQKDTIFATTGETEMMEGPV